MELRGKKILIELMSWGVAISTLILLIVFISGGCKTIEYVEVPKVSHDTINIYNTRVDSIRFYDSISIKGKNDTIFVEKFRYRDRYHKIHDSIYLSRTDTLTKVEVREIEKKLTKMESLYLGIGRWLWWILIAVALYFAWRIIRRFL